MRLPRRAVALTLALLTMTASSPAFPAAAVSKVQETASARMGQPCPSMAGEILTRPDYPWYIVDKAGYLRGIPPGVPDRIFTPGIHPRTDVPLETCAMGQDLSSHAAIITANDAVRPWYLYTNGKKYGLRPGIPEKYHLDGNKLQTMTVAILDGIPDGGLWD
ncbi:hypothetical protein BC793_13249 [Actinoplanes xinjiangensis]|uniref:Uncharacterized protein n=1 Tax=Actinoplanes xinjiangensis TaxID=512350 RepID=A0A316EKA6_9ACTN|nr:hypothetical protein BC793_13249 [Actinoplanes xinjiangensis]GIF43926.1 hypothetical protein Axi01nite_82370 [Actinoplanes xinjiangensis]